MSRIWGPGRARRRRPTLRERSVATRQLAVMVGSGLPLERAVGVLARQEGNPCLVQAWREIHLGLLRGRPLSRGMARHSETFGLLEVGLTRAGEASGALVPILGQLADLQEIGVLKFVFPDDGIDRYAKPLCDCGKAIASAHGVGRCLGTWCREDVRRIRRGRVDGQ